MFLITLASSFILILFLVYHFKSRILDLEKRCDKLFAIVQSIAENMTEQENINDQNVKNVFTPFGSYPLNSEPMQTISDLNNVAIQHMDLLEMNDSESEEDEDEEDDESSESESDVCEDEKITVPTIVKKEEIDESEQNLSVDSQFYKKMPVAQLRQMVISKGFTENANKLKKPELIQLLCQE